MEESFEIEKDVFEEAAKEPLILEFRDDVINPTAEEFKRIRDQLNELYAKPLGRKVVLLPPGITLARCENCKADADLCARQLAYEMIWQEIESNTCS